MKRTFLSVILLLTICCIKVQAQSDASTAAADTDKIYTSVERPPYFPGGFAEFNRFLASNIVYPPDARKNKTEGRVIIQFLIEKDGSLSNITVVQGVSGEIDAEALRVMKISPKWHAGKENGQPVRVSYSVPIAFTLPK